MAPDPSPVPTLNTRQAAFIGVGAMVGAGIFSLLGAAGEVAGAAVWVSFLLAGGVAGLQGYSFAKFGSRYPRPVASGDAVQGFGTARSGSSRLVLATNAIVTGMVAVVRQRKPPHRRRHRRAPRSSPW
jgi:amino acid transporter